MNYSSLDWGRGSAEGSSGQAGGGGASVALQWASQPILSDPLTPLL